LRRRIPSPLASAVAAVLVAGAIFAFFGHAFLNYDSFYALVWGKDLVHGIAPDYKVPVAPTPHPLAIAVGAALSPFGDGAEDLFLAIVLLAMGFLAVALYRLGRQLYAWPVGLLAAAIYATRVPPANFGIRGYVDLPAIAFVLWAAVLEARRPRRGWPVLVLLGLAGLLRPEAWLFIGAYWLWLFPALDWPAGLRSAALAAAAPVIWGVSDLLVTGDALWSLHGTHELAQQLGRKTGIANLPRVMPRRLGEIMRLPELVASVIGFAAGLAWLRDRTLLPAAIAVLGGLAYVGFAIAGLPLIGRYLFLPATMLALFAALAALGWTAVDRAREPLRRGWLAGGLVVLAGIVAFTPQQVDRLRALRTDIANRDRVQADLHALVKTDTAEHALDRCGTLFVPNHRPVPLLAYWTGRQPGRILSAQNVRPTPDGLFVAPATPTVAKLSVLDPRDLSAPAARPPGYRLLVSNRSWILYGGCRVEL
jgi:hypothetical protein